MLLFLCTEPTHVSNLLSVLILLFFSWYALIDLLRKTKKQEYNLILAENSARARIRSLHLDIPSRQGGYSRILNPFPNQFLEHLAVGSLKTSQSRIIKIIYWYMLSTQTFLKEKDAYSIGTTHSEWGHLQKTLIDSIGLLLSTGK